MISSISMTRKISRNVFTITAKIGNLWTMEKLQSRLAEEQELTFDIVDAWTIKISGKKDDKDLIEKAKQIVKLSFGYIDEVRH